MVEHMTGQASHWDENSRFATLRLTLQGEEDKVTIMLGGHRIGIPVVG